MNKNKNFTESLAEALETPEKSNATLLREEGLGKWMLGKSTLYLSVNVTKLILGVGIAAIAGEAIDHIPYMSSAIPDALNTLTNSNYFHGNLDKLGASLGFLSYYLNKNPKL